MKKLLVVLAAALLSAYAFADEIHLGTYIPMVRSEIDSDKGDTDFDTTGFGLKFDYTRISQTGFTYKGGLAIAYTETDDFNGNDKGGIDYDCGVGLGWTFINDPKMTLSVTGNLGLHMLYFSVDYELWGYKIDVTSLSTLFRLGPEVTFTYRFTDKLGAYAGLGIYYAFGVTSMEMKEHYNGSSHTDNDSYKTTGFVYMPSLGVSWKL